MTLESNLLHRMDDNVNGIKFAELSKTEIKDEASDWDRDKLVKECLCESGYSRDSINHLSKRERLKNLFANIIHLSKHLEKYKTRMLAHKIRSDIYKEKLEEKGVSPGDTVEKYFEEECSVDEVVESKVREIESAVEN